MQGAKEPTCGSLDLSPGVVRHKDGEILTTAGSEVVGAIDAVVAR